MSWWTAERVAALGTWIGGLATAAAVFVALMQIRADRRQYEGALALERESTHRALAQTEEGLVDERQRRDQDRLDRLWQQAVLIGCARSRIEAGYDGYPDRDNDVDTRPIFYVICRNDSQALIYDVRAFLVWQGVVRHGWFYDEPLRPASWRCGSSLADR